MINVEPLACEQALCLGKKMARKGKGRGIYYVNIDLRHQYGIFAAETQRFLRTKRPHASGEERGETAVFAGYVGSCR